jgi:two-component system cell cycle sensor histidine kinase/response regulator CckA
MAKKSGVKRVPAATDSGRLKKRVDSLTRELAETSSFLNDVLASSTGYSVIAKDLAGNILTWNEGARKNYGYSAEEMVGKGNARQLHTAEDMDSGKVQALLQTALDTGKAEGVFQRVRKNGEKFIATVSVTLRKDAKGKPIGYLLISKDMTEHISLTEQLRKQNAELEERAEEKFRQLVENIHQVYFLCGPRGAPMYYISRSYETVWGATCESLYKEPLSWIAAIIPEDREVVENLLSTRTDGFETEYRIRRPDGAVRWIRARSFPIVGKDGRLARLGGVAEDITDIKQTQVQLQQAQKMESVGRLAGGVAHDFNNLLTAIIGYSEFLVGSLAPDDKRRGDVEQILKAGERASALTRQLLAFSRQQVLRLRVLDCNALVADLEKMLRRIIGEDVELATLLGPKTGLVKGDPGQIEQVLMNLVVNAKDAMPNGGRITIETSNVELKEDYARMHLQIKPGAYVMLAVTDTGTGMDSKTLSHLFEPFFTTKEQGKGTGLGLATVYGIVKQSGGGIYVYSEPGHGTTFKVYLPRVAGAVQPAAAASPAARFTGAETILLVEDDELVRTFIHRALVQSGYTVLVAADPAAAARLCERHGSPIHLLLTDVIMPQMHGPELVKRLSLMRHEMKVIYMSGYTDTTVAHRDLVDKGVNFLQKPLVPDVLARKVREVLDGAA